MSRLKVFFDIIKVVVLVFATALLIRVFVFQPYIVEGQSMEPDYHDGEYLLIQKISYRFENPQRGEVIVFKYPQNPTENYIKRIIALPGDDLKIENGHVYVNGDQISENYLIADQQTIVGSANSTYQIKLSSSEFFVMGDNRSHSSDSRSWGPLDKKFIIGKIAFVLYPNKSNSASIQPVIPY